MSYKILLCDDQYDVVQEVVLPIGKTLVSPPSVAEDT